MVRSSILAIVAVATMAASPLKSGFSTYAVLDPSSIGDQSAPAQAPAGGDKLAEQSDGYAPAPMPDSDAAAPQRGDEAAQPQLQASLFTPQRGYHGEGYLPGSTVQGSQDRRKEPAPGFSLKVPLE